MKKIFTKNSGNMISRLNHQISSLSNMELFLLDLGIYVEILSCFLIFFLFISGK
jgi:hypothetical protein